MWKDIANSLSTGEHVLFFRSNATFWTSNLCWNRQETACIMANRAEHPVVLRLSVPKKHEAFNSEQQFNATA